MKPELKLDFERKLASFTLSVRLDAGPGITVLFGPSGSGKTQTLDSIAGLASPDAGEIVFGETVFFRKAPGKDTANLPARHRRVGYVFQNYALFPHMTALENVEFPLRKQGGSRLRSLELLAKMHLDDLAGRYPHELSGGQQQRVAIARSLAADSKLLLLDEPFSALDSFIREKLHEELRTLQSETGLIVIYVTHNLDDALAVGNRMAIMREGRIEQAGEIETVLNQPASRSVLEILGLPNIISATVTGQTDEHTLLDWQGLPLKTRPTDAAPGSAVTACIAPADISIGTGEEREANCFKGTVVRKRTGRMATVVIVRLDNGLEIEVVPGAAVPNLGEIVSIGIPVEKIKIANQPLP